MVEYICDYWCIRGRRFGTQVGRIFPGITYLFFKCGNRKFYKGRPFNIQGGVSKWIFCKQGHKIKIHLSIVPGEGLNEIILSLGY